MNINRNNYETYFLLYIDAELDDDGRKAVESFVRDNPDLKCELDALQQTICLSDDICFPGKEGLFKNEISLKDQENLLLHLDNELSETEAEQVKSQIDSDDGIKREWQILQQTKLDPAELIRFSDKSLLYKKVSGGRVVAFNYRMLAAAVVTGILFCSVYFLTQPGGNGETQVVEVAQSNTKPVSHKPKTDPVLPETHLNTIEPEIVEPVIGVKDIATDKKNVQKKNTSPARIISPVQPVENSYAVSPVNNNAIKNNDRKSNEPKRINVQPLDKEEILIPEPSNLNLAQNKSEPMMDVDVTKRDNSNASFASVTGNENDNQVFYMDEEKISRSKLAGFIKKAKRVVERNTKIKTSEGLHIGGFEIALK